MVEQYHGKKLRKKATGGLRKKASDKRLTHIGGHFAATKLAEKEERVAKRTRGGSNKIILKYVSFANVSMPDGKAKKAKILRVLESPANRHYQRMAIITKGAVVETEVGKVRITSRVGQHGVANGILVTS
jgi:small subunit ribosomal protein S8e